MKTTKPKVKISRLPKLIAMAMLMAFIIITHTACGDETPPSKTDFCLDTSCTIIIYDDMDEEEAQRLLDDAFALIRDYEQLFSKTIEDSDVSKINSAEGQWVDVDEETIEVITTANIVAYESGGAFDVTIGKVTQLWDFKSENPKKPADADIQAARQHVNYQRLNNSGESVILTDSDANIDLGGVAKGYIADKVAEFLEEQGVGSAVINLGGNVVCIGEKAEDTPWTVGIERPFTDRKELVGTVKVADATVVTSGIYERNFEEDGKIYHHIINPATGYPAETDLDAVTIIAKKGNSGFCDAVSTACLILGKEKAIKFIEKLQERYYDMSLEAAFIDNNGDIVQTEGMNIEFSE